MNELVDFGQALADETRVRILHLVKGEALCVCELADILRMPQSSVSSHIQVIKRAGLLASERCEKWIYYRLETRYVRLLVALGEFFNVAKGAVLAGDSRRAVIRLAERAESCCPGPKRLAGRRNGRGDEKAVR